MQVLVNDFSWLGRFLNDDRFSGIVEVFSNLSLLSVFIDLTQEVLLLGLCLEDDDGVACRDGIFVDLLDRLLYDFNLFIMEFL